MVLRVIEDSKVPLAPKQVFDELNPDYDIKHSTVKNYLRDLFNDEKILQPYRGYYCNRLTYSVIGGPLAVHDVHYKINAPFLKKMDKFKDVTEYTGAVKIFVQFGKQRRNISGYISNDVPGMTKDTLLFAFNRILDIIERDTGHVVMDGFTITTFETNRDFLGRRLDGQITRLSRKQLFDVIEKVYQKDDETVRAELKLKGDWDVEEAVSILKNDLPDVNVSQGLYVVKNRVDAIHHRIQFWNSELVQINRHVDFLSDKTENQIKGLTEHVARLLESDAKIVSVLDAILDKLNGASKSADVSPEPKEDNKPKSVDVPYIS